MCWWAISPFCDFLDVSLAVNLCINCSFFIARQQRSMLMRDIDIAILYVRPSVRLSVRYVPVPDENGLIYRHTFSLYGR